MMQIAKIFSGCFACNAKLVATSYLSESAFVSFVSYSLDSIRLEFV